MEEGETLAEDMRDFYMRCGVVDCIIFLGFWRHGFRMMFGSAD